MIERLLRAHGAEAERMAPERLALILPLLSGLGLAIVALSATLGASAPALAAVAGVGFALNAAASAVLVEAMLVRPLQGALNYLRAARDGETALGPRQRFATGLVGDLVHVVNDIGASLANLGIQAAAMAQCERMIVVGGEAARAFRENKEPPAPAMETAQIEAKLNELLECVAREGETTREAAGALREELAIRLDALTASEPSGLDRLAEAVQSNGDATRHALRAQIQALTETIDAMARNAPTAETLAALTPQDETPKALEALRAALAGGVYDRREIDALMTNVAEATRRLAEAGARLEGAAQRPEAPRDDANQLQALAQKFDETAKAHAERLDAVEGNVVQQLLCIERDNDATTLTALLRATKHVNEAAARLDGRPSGEAGADWAGRLEALAARIEDNLAAPPDLSPVLAGLEALQAAVAGADSQADAELRRQIDALGARLEAQGGDAAKLQAGLVIERIDALAEAATSFNALRRLIDGLGERLEAQIAQGASAQARLVIERLDSQDGPATAEMREICASAADAAAASLRWRLDTLAEQMQEGGSQPQIDHVLNRLDALAHSALPGAVAGLGKQVEGAVAGLRRQLDALAEAVAPEASQARIDPLMRKLDGAQAAADLATASLKRQLEALEADAILPARAALEQARDGFAGATARLERTREALETRGAQTLARDLEALKVDITETWRGDCANLVNRLETLVAAPIAEMGERQDRGLADLRAAAAALASQIEAAAQGSAAELAAKLDGLGPMDMDALKADLSAAAAASAERFDEIGRALSKRIEEKVESLRRGEIVPAVTALQTTAKEFNRVSVEMMAAVDAQKALTKTERPAYSALKAEVAALGETLQARAPDLERLAGEVGRRFDAFAETQSHRAEALHASIANRAVAIDRSAVSSALSMFRMMTHELAQTQAKLDDAVAA